MQRTQPGALSAYFFSLHVNLIVYSVFNVFAKPYLLTEFVAIFYMKSGYIVNEKVRLHGSSEQGALSSEQGECIN